MTISENLERLVTAKNDIAEAIRNKDVEVADTDGFEEFPELISRIGGAIDPSDLTYNKIAEIVRSGNAEKVFRIGDQITTIYTNTEGNQYNMPWDVVAFREVELEDGSKVPGMIIQSHYATVEYIQFDAPEPSSSDSDVKLNGWNRWMYSGVRQWLNSDKEKGQWWTAQHPTDASPQQLSTYNGFMKGLPTDFIGMLKKTKHETALNYVYPSGNSSTYVYDTTYDMFFLPSMREEHCQYSSYPVRWDSSDKEGTDWGYWIERKGETPQDVGSSYTDTNAIRYSLRNRSTAETVWLRSAPRNYKNTGFAVNSSGYILFNQYTSNSRSCVPAAVIC